MSQMSALRRCCSLTCNRAGNKPRPPPWCCWCKIPPTSTFPIVTRSALFRQIGNERGRGLFVQTVLAVRPQTREVLGCLAKATLCAHSGSKGENNGLNGASEKSAKLMSGYARCRPLAHLSQQACGCMSEIEGRI